MRRAHPTAHRELLASRCAAVVAGATAALHVPAALGHAGQSLVVAALLLVMALVCLPCAGHLWRCPGPRSWLVVAVLGTAMLAAHAVLLQLPAAPVTAPAAAPVTAPAAAPVAAAHAHHATGLPLAGSGALLPAALLVGTAAEVLACAALLLRRCGRTGAGERRSAGAGLEPASPR